MQTTEAPSAEEGVSPERANLAKTFEITDSERNAKAKWTRDTALHVTLDPSTETDMTLAQFMDCRVFTQLVDKTDTVEVQYGTETISCTDALEVD